MEDILFWIVNKLVVFILMPFVILFILLIPFLIYFSIKEETNCIEKQKQLVHHSSWVQYIPVGKAVVPIFHSDHDSMDWVCVKYKEVK